MTLHFTLILQVNTHCIARYIDFKVPSDSISKHFLGAPLALAYIYYTH